MSVGEDGTVPDLFCDRVIRYVATYNATDGGAQEVRDLLEQYKGEEDDCLAYLAITYGDEPSSEQSSQAKTVLEHHTARLTAFYKHYAPEKLASVGKMAETYQEDFPKMWKTLESRFGPELDVRLALGGLGGDAAAASGPAYEKAQSRITELEAKVAALESQLQQGKQQDGAEQQQQQSPTTSTTTAQINDGSSGGVEFATGLTPFSSLDTAVNMFYYLSGNQAADFMLSGFAANHQDAGLPKIFKYLWSIRQNKAEPFIQRKTASIGVSGVFSYD